MVICADKIKVMLMIKASLFRSGVEQALSTSNIIELLEVSEINAVPYSGKGPSRGVAIIDLDVSGGDGYATARQLKTRLPETGIIAFTSNFDDLQLLQVLKAQASACLRKDVSANQLLETIYKVASGQHPIKETLLTRPFLADQVFRQFQQLSQEWDDRVTSSNLTVREIEILRLVAKGLMNKQIASQLEISEQTIKNHVSSIMRKLGVNSRQEAVALSRKQGMLLPG
jgi:two-component system, NarL family, response regulator DegU